VRRFAGALGVLFSGSDATGTLFIGGSAPYAKGRFRADGILTEGFGAGNEIAVTVKIGEME
jgi:hypothetical protein